MWVTYKWVNIGKGQLRTCVAEEQPEARSGFTELTQKHFISFGHNNPMAAPSERPVQRAGFLFAVLTLSSC